VGHLYQLWDLNYDPTDTSNPRGTYTPYDFTSVGHSGIAKGSMTRDWGRRESVQVIPGMDSVLDGNGRLPAPMDRRDVTFSFTVWTNGDNDAAESLLRAQVAPGYPQRLVYRTDSDTLWYTVGYNPSIKQTSAAENNWGDGGECNFAVTWRIRPYWTPRYSQAADLWQFAPEAFAADNSETFISPGTTAVTSGAQSFLVDATGTAGFDLPTLPDTAPTFFFAGPLGGTGGFVVQNYNAMVRDTNGVLHPMMFTVPYQLPDSSHAAALNFATQTFQLTSGTYFRPVKPLDANGRSYQRGYFEVTPGVVNNCVVVALGSSPLTGGSIQIDWYKHFA
jgi:hypothetical protein